MRSKAVVTEVLLHFIWRFRLFNSLDLKTTCGESIYIEQVGIHNHNAGPDFEYARIRIGNTFWSGHVEIHVKEEGWLLHGHHLDHAYDNVILHVVWESTSEKTYRSDGTPMPTLVLSSLVDKDLVDRYKMLMSCLGWIPCEKQIASIELFTIQNLLSRLSVERLEKKTSYILTILKERMYDWEKVFLIVLGRSFGMKVNADPFEELCSRIDLKWLHKNKEDSHKVESMLFGLAGFLADSSDVYSENLRKEYSYLQGVYNWESMEVMQWKFLRMRPYNFPPYRIGQLAGLLGNKTYWFSYILDTESILDVFDGIDNSGVNLYWATHYRFGYESSHHSTSISLSFKIHLAINCFIPVLFAYAEYMKLDNVKDKALSWLNALSPEKNKITKKFSELGVKCSSASDSQALLQLKNSYCDLKRCLECAVGLSILNA